MEWWEEQPVSTEEEWEDVNKRIAKKKPEVRGGRGRGRSEGRGREAGRGGRGDGGRGRTGEGRGAGRGRSTAPRANDRPKNNTTLTETSATADKPVADPEIGIPNLNSVPAPLGAWAKKTGDSIPAEVSAPDPVPTPAPVAAVTPPSPVAPMVSTPAAPGIRATSGGNVWATKGSAHLIRAEKPKPPAPAAPSVPKAEAPRVRRTGVSRETPTTTAQPPASVHMNVPVAPAPPAPATTAPTTTANAWSKSSAVSETSKVDLPPSAVGSKHIGSMSPAAPPAPAAPLEMQQQTKPPKAPGPVLNMGRWETTDADDANLDFGFGSFDDAGGPSHQVNASVTENEIAPPAPAASPARPPPGLSLTGIPPMPSNAVMVHELENKLEGATLNASAGTGDNNPHPQTSGPSMNSTAPGMYQGGYGQPYGIPGSNNIASSMGMYNYNAPGAQGNAFAGMPGGVPGLGGPSQPKLGGGIPPVQAGGLYAAAQPEPSSGNESGSIAASNPTDPNATPGMPPGMPNMPYGNPALYYGGQAPFHMGQHQGGMGYNYGYGAQFGGAVQGGFGYPQGMGQSAGYAPHYGDQHEQQGSHGNSGGYQKNNGNYRARNQHHNNNQYHNQYQQHGGYGGQPYNMGYQGDHFQQRGGYGQHGGMPDPYNMQQQPQQHQGGGNYGGGFQDDEQYKGKKGGNRPFHQQGPPQALGTGQQTFGLQGQVADSSQPSSGWSNQQGATGGWGGGTPSWQQNK
jgi:hypothetical protein